MLYVGLDLSRKRVDFDARRAGGELVARGAAPADADGLAGLVRRLGDARVLAVLESMNGARFVHDQLERFGWDVRIADAVKTKGLAPLACKTDRIDAGVLAELARLDLVPEIWLPDPSVRAERELARFRLHLVKHRSALKNRVHASLIAHGVPNAHSDLFGAGGRRLLGQLQLPQPWQATTSASLALIDQLDAHIHALERELRQLGAEHRYIPLLMTCPGIGWVLGFTIAAEIGHIERFPSPAKLTGYSGLCPTVNQSGARDRRGPLSKHGPRYLRWALVEAATTACRHPAYRARYQRTKTRLGKQRGAKVAQIELARTLTKAIWHMLTHDQPFAPASATVALAA
jgi:transposase